jgi:hypothetical protein
VDQSVYYVQGKAELVNTADLAVVLQDFFVDKLALYRRHEAGARLVSGYEVNNTYQYILAREDVHLAWLRAAIDGVGGTIVESASVPDLPSVEKNDPGARAVLEDDLRLVRAFIERWRPRVAAVTHDRHRRMLDVILGELQEHQRFFEQAVAGRTDLLGRRAEGAGTGGGVMAARWVT